MRMLSLVLSAGAFGSGLNNPRSYAGGNLGGRSAFYE